MSIPRVRLQRLSFRDWVFVILAIGVIISAFQSTASNGKSTEALDQVKEQSACLVTFSDQLYVALARRGKDSEDLDHAETAQDEALDHLLRTFLKQPPASVEQAREALQGYRDATEERTRAQADLDETRRDASYPQPPREVCSHDE